MSEVLGPKCLVDFSMEDTVVDSGGAHALGSIGCYMQKCPLYRMQDIPGNVEAGPNGDLKAAAESKVLARARAQMTYECAVWKAASENHGQDIPNDRLPQILQRRSQS